MKKINWLLMGFIVIIISNKVNAQSDTSDVRIKVFEYDDKKTETYSDVMTAIKVSPYALIAGELPIFVERQLWKVFSAEAGVGITFQDFIYNSVGSVFSDEAFFSGASEYEDIRVHKNSYSLRANLRYYPDGEYDAIDGAYVGIQVRHRSFKSEIDRQVLNDRYDASFGSGVKIASDLSEYRKVTDFGFIMGYQAFWDYNICFESQVGFGYRMSNNRYVMSDQTYDDPSGYYITYIKPVEYQSNVPYFSLDFRFGIGF